MKILYDHQVFSWQRVGGISRYFTQLQYLLKAKNTTLISNNEYLHSIDRRVMRLLPNLYIPGKTQLIKLMNTIWSNQVIKSEAFDIFHPTYYDNYFLGNIKNKPYVVTVFDMIHELFPEDFPGDHTSDLKRQVIEGASKVIAISETTKSDLINLLDINPQKINVIYLASSIKKDNSKRITLPDEYLLYVGDRGKYKNFTSFVEATKNILINNSELGVICVGGGSFTTNELKNMGNLKHKFQRLDLTDEEMSYVYQHANCLVLPSLYEGFGLPIVEAMECGCPVVCSDTPSLREVAGDAAIYFNRSSIEEMRTRISNLMANNKLRKDLISQGYIRARKFSWEKCAKETLDTYRKAIA